MGLRDATVEHGRARARVLEYQLAGSDGSSPGRNAEWARRAQDGAHVFAAGGRPDGGDLQRKAGVELAREDTEDHEVWVSGSVVRCWRCGLFPPHCATRRLGRACGGRPPNPSAAARLGSVRNGMQTSRKDISVLAGKDTAGDCVSGGGSTA